MNQLKNCRNNSPFAIFLKATDTGFYPNGIAFANIYSETDYMFTIRKHQHFFIREKYIALCNFLFLLLLLLFSSCQSANNKNLTSPPEYDLNKPSVVKLPNYLDEISGIAFLQKDKSVFAISDDKGWLYKIFLSGNMAIQKWKFAKKADFEDIVLVDSTFYVLQSNGHIFSLHFFSPDSITVNDYKLSLPGKNEFETLYLDKEQNRLIMLCKDCEADDKNSLSSWAFDLSALTFSSSPAYIIDVRKIEDLLQEKKVKFKPSAAAIHPLTGQLFMISSLNKVLVVADKNGIPENVYKINPALYKQPEGLTFTPDGHLLISNESAETGAANILFFKYNKGK